MSVLKAQVEPFLERLDAVLEDGYGAVLYGSLARGDHIPGWSDVNLLLLADHLDFDTLAALVEPVDAWVRGGLPAPLIMSRREWSRASDVFPIEITDMQVAYRVLRGPDPIGSIRVPPASLRWALERELRGKLNRLRQGYLPVGRRPADLGLLAEQSIAGVVVLMRGLLALSNRPVPADAREAVRAAAGLAGFPPAALERIVARRGDRDWACSRGEFEDYIRAVELAVRYVDEHQPGETA